MNEIVIRIFEEQKNDFKIITFENNASICSGYADCNKKPIFTGDIIGFEETDYNEMDEKIVHKYTGIVLFDEGLFCVDLLDATTWNYGNELDLVMSNSNNIYVIGNIFQDNDILEILKSKREKKN
jgi:uncharacterized phage protein (TIGR01671 family)